MCFPRLWLPRAYLIVNFSRESVAIAIPHAGGLHHHDCRLSRCVVLGTAALLVDLEIRSVLDHVPEFVPTLIR